MRLVRIPETRRAFAERRVGTLHVVAVLALVGACWFAWSQNRAARRGAENVSAELPSLVERLPGEGAMSNQGASSTRTNVPAIELEVPTDRGSSNDVPAEPAVVLPATNIADEPYAVATNSSGAVDLPNWITERSEEASYQGHPARNVLEAQVGMASRGVSPGPIDGLMGTQTRLAIRAFQEQLGIPISGELDAYTRRALWVRRSPLTSYVVTTNDIARLMTIPDTWLGKSELPRMDYETVLEVVAERGWAYESFIQRLNPDVDWSTVPAGSRVTIPNVSLPQFNSKAAYARIHLSGRNIQAFDGNGRIMVHFPCSIAQRVDKRPLGELKVAVVVRNPNYTFDPDIFTESEEGRRLGRKLELPPGPNNPVGIAWVGLDRPGYGIHGTPAPELVGRTESHGCFRLANWNAQILVELSWVGMPVFVEP